MKETLVLVIEHDKAIRSSIRYLLLSKDYLLLETDELKKGQDLFLHGEPDSIILDQDLPNLLSTDGSKLESFINEIRTQDPSIPILLLTTHCPQDLLLRLIRFERITWVQKPIDTIEFLTCFTSIQATPLINPNFKLRNAYRVETNIPVEIEGYGQAEIQNLSSTGAFISTKASFEISKTVSLYVNLPSTTLLRSKVLWTRSENPLLKTAAGIGIEFSELNTSQKNILSQFLAQEVLKEKRFANLARVTAHIPTTYKSLKLMSH